MKIFVPTTTHPSKRSSPVLYIKNILKNLKTVSCVWLLYQPQKFQTSHSSQETVLDIHDYNNAIQVLKEVKPDCVITNNNKYVPVDFAFSLAAKFLNIPLINYKIVDLDEPEASRNLAQMKSNIKRNLQKVLSKNSKSNTSHSSFIILKNKFLYETKKSIGVNRIKNAKSQLDNIMFHFVGNPSDRFLDLADLHLVNNDIWLKMLKESGIDEKRMVVTGNPYWDELYQIYEKEAFSKEPINHKPIKILVVTNPLVEHGHWSEKEREEFISSLIEILSKDKNFLFSFKIHPSSEDIGTYVNYLKKINVDAKIYQKESFWDIAKNFDVVISYGYSTIHSEIAIAGYRMLLINVKKNLRRMPILNSGIKSGFIEECDYMEQLPMLVENLIHRKIEFHQNHTKEIEKLLYKFDGKSGMRAAEAIMMMMNEKEN